MRLLSVNVGRPRPDGDRKAKTGIYKEPVPEAKIGELGVESDAVVNKRHHGGKDQAVYLYATEDYAWWSSELGRDLSPGTFGENLTTEGLDVTALAIGDRLMVGEVEFEVTSPRIPCATLARRMDAPGFVARFLAAKRPGAYFRVLRTGEVKAGDLVRLQPYEGERVTLVETFEGFHHPVMDETDLRRILAAPLGERLRKHKEVQLAKLLSRA